MKVVVWGLPLHSHTHSYIHQAFHRASLRMGFETHWVSNNDESNSAITEDSIVICCGVDDDKLKAKHGTKYVLHNSSRDDLRNEKHINLQVYTHDVLERKVEDWGDLTFWQSDNRTLYQPWATDILPHEFDNIDLHTPRNDMNDVMWIGSVMSGIHGNYEEILKYANICSNRSISFKQVRCVSIEENIKFLHQSRHSVAIQGKWQVEKGYIPCRIFKNISYGCLTTTNSPTVSSLLGLPLFENFEDMFEHSESHVSIPKMQELLEKRQIVKERHTYVNRLDNIMKCLDIA